MGKGVKSDCKMLASEWEVKVNGVDCDSESLRNGEKKWETGLRSNRILKMLYCY